MNVAAREMRKVAFLRSAVRFGCAAATVLAAVLLALPCRGQSSGSGGQSNHPIQSQAPRAFDEPMTGSMVDPIFMERRLQMLNAAQHKAMVADTDKLLKLVSELNAEISSTNADSLTAGQLRKIAEIEKLAHSVKDKMRMSVWGAAGNNDVLPMPAFSRH